MTNNEIIYRTKRVKKGTGRNGTGKNVWLDTYFWPNSSLQQLRRELYINLLPHCILKMNRCSELAFPLKLCHYDLPCAQKNSVENQTIQSQYQRQQRALGSTFGGLLL